MSDPAPAAGPSVILARTANAALHAPSILNTQPWRWVVRDDTLALYAVDQRRLDRLDPEGHLLLLSCGAALHHARIALAAESWTYEVERATAERYDESNAAPLAVIRLREHAQNHPEAMRHFQATLVRHTDRRTVTDEPVDPAAVSMIRDAVRREGGRLHIAHPDEVHVIAVAVERAERAESLDERQREELDAWLDGARTERTGVPDETIPDQPPQTTVPIRDFGRSGGLPAGAGHDQAAVYAVLYGDGDGPIDWLRGGEALSAAWLAATELGLTVLPYSAPIEVIPSRLALRRLLAGLGYPYLVMRIGAVDPDHAGAPHTPRLAAEETIEIVD
jgi:nitroreductase